MTARPWPNRYTRAKLQAGAKDFLFIPRVGPLSQGTIDAFGWKPPFFDDEGNEIREDGVNLGTLPDTGNKFVPALPGDAETTRQLTWNETFEQWQLRRKPPDDFANLDWRGQAGDPAGKQQVLHFWGPPSRYFHAADNGEYPPYTDKIYRRGALYLQAPGEVCGCALHKTGGSTLAACMSPVGGTYADGNITHDKLYARVVRGPQPTQDKTETALFVREDFDALVNEFAVTPLEERAAKREEVIAYSQRWHEIDLKDHPDLVDTTLPPSGDAADNDRTTAELFPWHFNGSGTECQTLRRMTAQVQHSKIAAHSNGLFDLKTYRYDRLKLQIAYNRETVTLVDGTEVAVLAPTVTAQRITNKRVPMWDFNDARVDTVYAENVDWFPSFTSAENIVAGHVEGLDECPPVEPFVHNISYDPDTVEGKVVSLSQNGHLSSAGGKLFWVGGDPNDPGLNNQKLVSDTEQASRSETGIVVAVDYQGDTEVLATVDYEEIIDARYETLNSNISNFYVEREVACGRDTPSDPWWADYRLDLHGGQVTDVDPTLATGFRRELTIDYDRTVTLNVGGNSIDLYNEALDTSWHEATGGFTIPATGGIGKSISHVVDKTVREIDHLDLRQEWMAYTETRGEVEQSGYTSSTASDALVRINDVPFTTRTGLPEWYFDLEIRSDAANRVADELFTEKAAIWRQGAETQVLHQKQYTPQNRDSEIFNDLATHNSQFIKWQFFAIDNEPLAEPKLIGTLLAETAGGSDNYVSGEADWQAMPVDWTARLGGWSIDNAGQVMVSQMGTFNPSQLQYDTGMDTPEADEVVAASHFDGGDLVTLNELIVPAGEQAAFFNCAFAGD